MNTGEGHWAHRNNKTPLYPLMYISFGHHYNFQAPSFSSKSEVKCYYSPLLLSSIGESPGTDIDGQRQFPNSECEEYLLIRVKFNIGNLIKFSWQGFCAVVGMATHFVFLSAFAWMGIEGFIVYKMVVDVFESGTDNKIKLRLVAYGVPLVIVLIFLIVHVSTDGSTYGGEL